MTEMGRWCVVAGVVLLVVGGILLLVGHLPWSGRLPGDIVIDRDHLKVFIPLGTMLVVSLVLTVVVNVVLRLWRKEPH
ncbi:MAG: DUF2905 domain-containing protein [Chloroflexaceae bacterium]|nr:DUF2905 domain-containing protein [Chloroflexaceae bacterium]